MFTYLLDKTFQGIWLNVAMICALEVCTCYIDDDEHDSKLMMMSLWHDDTTNSKEEYDGKEHADEPARRR